MVNTDNWVLKKFRAFKQGLGWLFIRYVGFIPSMKVRLFIYRHVLNMKIANDAKIYGGATIWAPSLISIGEHTAIGEGVILDGRLGIEIGSNVNFSTGVWVWMLQHDLRDPDFGCNGGKVTIGNRARVSCRAVVLPGVTIGEGAVVAAGAVVTEDVQPYTVVGGVPAKKIGERPRNLRYIISDFVPFI